MPDEFEQEMQERMQDFTISPGPHVWKQVEAALPEEKRKRRIAFWWLLPLALLLGGCIWYGVAKNDTQLVAKNEMTAHDADGAADALKAVKQGIETTDTVTKNSEQTFAPATSQDKASSGEHQQPIIIDDGKNPVYKDTIQPNASKPVSADNMPAVKAQDVTPVSPPAKNKRKNLIDFVSVKASDDGENIVDNRSYQPAGNDATSMPTTRKKAGANEPFATAQNAVNKKRSKLKDADIIWANTTTNIYSSNAAPGIIKTIPADTIIIVENTWDDDVNKDNASTPLLSTVNGQDMAPAAADTILLATATNDSLIAPEPTTNTSPIADGFKKGNAITWQFFGSAGISNTKSKLFSGQEKSLRSYTASGLNQGSGSGSAFTNGYPQSPTPGFSYTAGGERFQVVSKHWQWYAAFQYSFMSNQQKTGTRKDSAITNADNTGFNNASTESNGSAPGFYYPGSSLTHTNTIHQFGLQTGLQYTITPNGKRPLSFRGGFMANWQVATTQLLYNATRGAYYYAPDATHHFTFATQLGLDWRLTKRLTIGAFFQYNFTRINKPDLGVYLHWQMSGVRVAIPLRRKGVAKRYKPGL